MLQFGASLTYDTSSINYDHNMFIIQATGVVLLNVAAESCIGHLPELNVDGDSFSLVEHFRISPVLALAVVNDHRVDQSVVVLDHLWSVEISFFFVFQNKSVEQKLRINQLLL